MLAGNPFMDQGNSEVINQMKAIQIATIRSVNVEDMTADIEFLGHKGGKTKVALAQPMAGAGFGIYAIPRRGTIVAVGLREMQIPIILSYFPSNIFSPHSFFSYMREEFSMVDSLAEGDVFMRALSDIAKCQPCGETFSLSAWEASVDPETLLQQCPGCGVPAAVLDSGTGQAIKINKIHFGTTFHMRSNGTVEFQLNNMADPGSGDTERLLKIIITPDSAIQILNAGDVLLNSDKSVTVDCQDLMLNARGSINQRASNKGIQVSEDDVETCASKSIIASDGMLLEGDSTTLKANTILSIESPIRQATIDGDDVEEVGFKKIVSKGKIEVISTDDFSIESQKKLVLKATDDMLINAANIILQGGDKAVARVDDTTLADSSTDSVFFTWLTTLVTALSTSPTVALDGGAAYKAAIALALAGVTPTKIDGKITSGNTTVKA